MPLARKLAASLRHRSGAVSASPLPAPSTVLMARYRGAAAAGARTG